MPIYQFEHEEINRCEDCFAYSEWIVTEGGEEKYKEKNVCIVSKNCVLNHIELYPVKVNKKSKERAMRELYEKCPLRRVDNAV